MGTDVGVTSKFGDSRSTEASEGDQKVRDEPKIHWMTGAFSRP
jgi:hypothetical protein